MPADAQQHVACRTPQQREEVERGVGPDIVMEIGRYGQDGKYRHGKWREDAHAAQVTMVNLWAKLCPRSRIET